MAFKFYDPNKPGKGVSKEDQKKKGLKGFFILTKDFFWKLAVVNIFYVFFNFPVFFGLYALSGNLDVPFSTQPSLLAAKAVVQISRARRVLIRKILRKLFTFIIFAPVVARAEGPL